MPQSPTSHSWDPRKSRYTETAGPQNDSPSASQLLGTHAKKASLEDSHQLLTTGHTQRASQSLHSLLFPKTHQEFPAISTPVAGCPLQLASYCHESGSNGNGPRTLTNGGTDYHAVINRNELSSLHQTKRRQMEEGMSCITPTL